MEQTGNIDSLSGQRPRSHNFFRTARDSMQFLASICGTIVTMYTRCAVDAVGSPLVHKGDDGERLASYRGNDWRIFTDATVMGKTDPRRLIFSILKEFGGSESSPLIDVYYNFQHSDKSRGI